MVDVQQLLAELGYKQKYEVLGRENIADLFPKKTKQCGIYVLHFADGEYYVGQSVDFVSRFGQHRENYDDIQFVSFMPIDKVELNRVERQFVKAFEDATLPLRNVNIVTFSHAVRPFDEIMPKDVQRRWIEEIDFLDLDGDRANDEELRRKYQRKFYRLKQQPIFEEITEVLAQYVVSCIPCPKRTERAYWNVSCVVGKELLVRINVGPQVVFDVFHDENGAVYRYALFQADAEKVLGEEIPWGDDLIYEITDQENRRTHYSIFSSQLTKAGPNQAFILAHSFADALSLLDDEGAVKSIAKLNIGLCQKGPCLWARNHCLDLADAIFARIKG